MNNKINSLRYATFKQDFVNQFIAFHAVLELFEASRFANTGLNIAFKKDEGSETFIQQMANQRSLTYNLSNCEV
jgi:hypothetical protein